MPLCQGGVGDARTRHVTELPLPHSTVTIHQLSPRYPIVAQETWYAVQQRNLNNNIELKTSGKLLYMHIGQICPSPSQAGVAMHALHFLQSEAVVVVHVSIGTLLSLMSNLPRRYALSCTEARMGQPAMRLKAHVCRCHSPCQYDA